MWALVTSIISSAPSTSAVFTRMDMAMRAASPMLPSSISLSRLLSFGDIATSPFRTPCGERRLPCPGVVVPISSALL